jgi:hypothetical protein
MADLLAKIERRFAGRPAGVIFYAVQNEKSLMGRIRRADIPDARLRESILGDIRTNRRELSVIGGTIPESLERYYDGVVRALEANAEDLPGLEVDAPDIRPKGGVQY